MLDGNWRKSSRSGVTECVEVRTHDSMVEVRDSKNPNDSVLRFTNAEWRAFVGGAKDEEFDV